MKLIIIMILMSFTTFVSKAQNFDSIFTIIYQDTVLLQIYPYNSSNAVEWGPMGIDITFGNGAVNMYNGYVNTLSIVQQLDSNNSIPYAAIYCDTLNSLGFSDWYLPAFYELNAMMPFRFNIPNFIEGSYWASSELDLNIANRFYQSEHTWIGSGASKSSKDYYYARCIRREAITDVKMIKNDSLFIQINPNPAQEELFIHYKTENTAALTFYLYNVNGTVVLTKTLADKNGHERIALSTFADGIYIGKIYSNEKNVLTNKIVIGKK